MSEESLPCILVVAPAAFTHGYQGSEGEDERVVCACRVSEVDKFLSSRKVAAVVCHDASLDQEILMFLHDWYTRKAKTRPLLVLVTDLRDGAESHLLRPYSSFIFSLYHSRPAEVIAWMKQTSLPQRSGRKRRPASSQK